MFVKNITILTTLFDTSSSRFVKVFLYWKVHGNNYLIRNFDKNNIDERS